MALVRRVCVGVPLTLSPNSFIKAGVPSCCGTSTRPGLVQNWPAPRVKEACRPVATALPRLLQGAGQNEYGIYASHFGVARDRLRAGGGQLHQGGTAGKGSGKRDGFDGGVFHQLDTYIHTGIEEHGEYAFRQAARLHALADGLADQSAGSRMRRMGLDDDGIAGGERGSGVSPGDGEGQGKIAGAENGDRAQAAYAWSGWKAWAAACGWDRRCRCARPPRNLLPPLRRRVSAGRRFAPPRLSGGLRARLFPGWPAG